MGRWFWQKPECFIRRAEADDLATLAEIHEASFPHGWDADTLARMLAQNGMTAWVARRDGERGEPTGFVVVRNTGKEAEIITLAVAAGNRRRGVGNALMWHAIRHLQHERAERLFLEVSETNAPALVLYRRLGFRQVGERKGYYTSHLAASESPERAPSALVMELALR